MASFVCLQKFSKNSNLFFSAILKNKYSTVQHIFPMFSRSTCLCKTTQLLSQGQGQIQKSFFRRLFIETQETPNPNSIKFLPGKAVLSAGRNNLDFSNAKAAEKVPLAKLLFNVRGVRGVFFGQDFITITKDDDDIITWSLMKPDIFAVVMDYFAANETVAVIEEPVDHNTDSRSNVENGKEDEVVTMIKELIETRIRPTVQEDGGDIVFKGFEEGVVKVKLQGSCTSCPSSQVTLKRGVQNMLQYYVPEVMGVIQVEDETDEISKSEFDKFEKNLENKGNET